MNILLTGASGFIGRHTLHALLTQGHQVTACSRNPKQLKAQFPQIKTLSLDFSTAVNADAWLPHLNDIDAVINAAGIIRETAVNTFSNIHTHAPLALFKACKQAGVKRIIHISAAGASSAMSTAYFRSKGIADEGLRMLDIDWFIIKPSLVYGYGAKSMGLFRGLAALPCIPLIGNGEQKIQPVHINDLAGVILCCLQGSTPARQTINAVGPAPVSFSDLLVKQRMWLGMPKPVLFSIPAAWLKFLAPLGIWLNEPAFNREAIDMLIQGNTADAGAITRLLRQAPKSLDQVLQETPATQADRWHARLYFMRPALRLSIALVWLWTGWVSAFIYPPADSYHMLDPVGIPKSLAPLLLYGASALDFSLGIAMLIGWRLRLVIYFQVAIMLIYTIVISLALPEYWAHPFGPMIKNLPLIVATFVLLTLEEETP